MSSESQEIDRYISREYEHGFVTDIQQDTFPPGLDESVIRAISAKKNEPEFLLEWRLQAFEVWKQMEPPQWAHVHYPPVDFQDISYYSAPKADADKPQSLDEVDPELLET
ncbi:MAG TPA: Fe-S cluster assembly protein SufB, partial [Gammaproteobacteria bacterium]|nr:Fe-S cluster assembly protein SufB [Gammaproteobacteria bacterium]